jgi:hypothetical protein
MNSRCLRTAAVGAALLAGLAPSDAQDGKDRAVEQYECKDVMRESGRDRDVAIAFLHGYLLGKSGTSKFNLDAVHRQTEAFIERCLLNPSEKAVDAMQKVKG